MVTAMKLVQLVAAMLALITRMRDINLELTKRVAHLTRKRPRAETLERLERQLVLPLPGLVAAGRAGRSMSSCPAKRKNGPVVAAVASPSPRTFLASTSS